MPAPGGEVQRGPIASVPGVHVGAALRQLPDRRDVPAPCDEMQRRFVRRGPPPHVGPADQQFADGRRGTGVGGPVQRRRAVLGLRVDLRAALRQFPDAVRGTGRGGFVQRRRAVLGLRVDVGSAARQFPDGFDGPGGRGPMQRCGAAVGLRVDVGPATHQFPDDDEGTDVGGAVQRGHAVGVPRVDVGPAAHQLPNGHRVAAEGRGVQRHQTTRVRLVDGDLRALRHEHPHRVDVAGGQHDLEGRFLVVGSQRRVRAARQQFPQHRDPRALCRHVQRRPPVRVDGVDVRAAGQERGHHLRAVRKRGDVQRRLSVAAQIQLQTQIAQRRPQPLRQRRAVDVQRRIDERVFVQEAVGERRIVQSSRVMQIRPAVLVRLQRRHVASQQRRQPRRRVAPVGGLRGSRRGRRRPGVGQLVEALQHCLQPVDHRRGRHVGTVGRGGAGGVQETLARQREIQMRLLPSVRGLDDRALHPAEHLDDLRRRLQVLQQRSRVRTVASFSVVGGRSRRCRVRHHEPGGKLILVEFAEAAAADAARADGPPHAPGQRVVPAGVEDHEPQRRPGGRSQHRVEGHGLEPHVRVLLQPRVHRHQVVDSVHLDAVAGVEHRRHVGAGARPRKNAERLVHSGHVGVQHRGHFESETLQRLADRVGVVPGIGQLPGVQVRAVAHDQRDAVGRDRGPGNLSERRQQDRGDHGAAPCQDRRRVAPRTGPDADR